MLKKVWLCLVWCGYVKKGVVMLNQYVNKSLRSSTLKGCGRCGYTQNGVVMLKKNLNKQILNILI